MAFNPQNFILIFGPPAVGKLTVGLSISRLTHYKVLHNHLAIECVLPIFPFGSAPFKKLVAQIRESSFRVAAESDIAGLVFTFVWDFHNEAGLQMVKTWIQIFRSQNWKVFFVELHAELEVRLVRNRCADRLTLKRSKRNIIESERILLNNYREWRMDGFAAIEHSLAVDDYRRYVNDHREADDIAAAIVRDFGLATPRNVSGDSFGG